MAIERLSLIDSVTASTYFAVNVNNQDYRAGAGTVASYVNSLVEQNPAIVADTIQYASPSTSFTFTLTNNGVSTWLAVTPLNTIPSGTIILPQVGVATAGQEILVTTTQSIGAFFINANGASVNGAPTSLNADECFKLKFEPISKVWYRVQSDWALNQVYFGTY
jgi:hypothetical protein